MKVVWTDRHAGHDPQFFLVRGQVRHSAEQPERAARLLEAACRSGLEPVPAPPCETDPLLAVHTLDYLTFLEDAQRHWRQLAESGPEVVANVHPQHTHRYPASYPRSIVGRAGWHMADCACPLGPSTWRAARASAEVAVAAAELVLAGEREVYALCRPPGHHAYADMAGGFCFLNNTALAAQHLRRRFARVAVLDIDVHHGNGTQGIFWERPDVLTVSVHADPCDYYPFFWGHAHERGGDAAEGTNLNLPLPVGSGDDRWLPAVEEALAAIRRFAPEALVLALGLDAHESDPLQGMRVTTPAFGVAAAGVARLDLPVLIVQEGGYLSPALGRNLESFMTGFRTVRRP